MKLNFEGLGEFSNQNDFERCVLVPKMTISIHVNAKNNLDWDLGQFCFLFIPREDDYGGLFPMKTRPTTCLVHLVVLHLFRYLQVPLGTPSTEYGPTMNVEPLGSTHG